MTSSPCCHVCGSAGLALEPGLESFRLVTSDCRPWKAGFELASCPTCGTVQKVIDEYWRKHTDQIYRTYAIYHQGGGAEQAVFDPVSGQSSSRSAKLLTQFATRISLCAAGRLLDVGCGNGALLAAFRKLRGEWELCGTELSDRYRQELAAIGASLYTCDSGEVPGQFDLVTMVHVLEHVICPSRLLTKLATKLTSDGLLLIEVPDFGRNPFDLLIADHCTHFSGASLARLLFEAGYEVVLLAEDWIAKELTVVARQAACRQVKSVTGSASASSALKWLGALRAQARELTHVGSLGLFGTSIGASWLFGELDGAIAFFVDEDPNRINRNYLGRPVYAPATVSDAANVLIALPTQLAGAIARRLKRPEITYHVPMDM